MLLCKMLDTAVEIEVADKTKGADCGKGGIEYAARHACTDSSVARPLATGINCLLSAWREWAVLFVSVPGPQPLQNSMH